MASRGWLENRGEDTYRLCVSAGLDGAGKQIIKRKTFHGGKREAQRALTAFAAEVERTFLTSGTNHTFAEFTERWLELHAESNLTPKTVSGYKGLLKNYILPAIGHVKLNKLTAVHLLHFYKRLNQDGARVDGNPGGLSPVSIGQIHRIIGSILQRAVEWNILASNVAENAKPPKTEHKEMKVYNEAQTVQMLSALEAEPVRHRALISIAVLAGLRRGECLGLEWSDIDFEGHTITIQRQSQYIEGRGLITTAPKTRGSKRTVAIPETLTYLLRTLKAEQNQTRLRIGELWHDNDRLFTTWNGEPMHPGSISKWFRGFQTRAGLPHIRFHDLRHISATLMITAGVDVKTVSKRLGHQQTSTTMNIYSHALESSDRGASDKMQALLDRSRHLAK